MPELTSGQAKDLARQFLSLGQSINKYRIDNWDNQTSEERKILSDLHWKIINYVDDFTSLSTTLILEDAEGDLENLQTVTTDIKKSVHRIEMVQKVINVAAAVVAVGAAIVARDPKTIGKEMIGLSKAWNEDLPSDK
ncbi:MAG: hypothetical protein WKF97_15405 [Chitinophagaceae bacterium]